LGTVIPIKKLSGERGRAVGAVQNQLVSQREAFHLADQSNRGLESSVIVWHRLP